MTLTGFSALCTHTILTCGRYVRRLSKKAIYHLPPCTCVYKCEFNDRSCRRLHSAAVVANLLAPPVVPLVMQPRNYSRSHNVAHCRVGVNMRLSLEIQSCYQSSHTHKHHTFNPAPTTMINASHACQQNVLGTLTRAALVAWDTR